MAAFTVSESLRQKELEVAREIAQAFLMATKPVEVYRLALARVTPLVGASFGSVFLRDEADPDLLKLACAQNWPQIAARFLGQMRIRVGRGPTGRAVALGLAIEVEDVFADPEQREWWEPARELGFSSLIALPLRSRDGVKGALSFYFESPRRFEDEERELLKLIADQLAGTAERAHLIENLQAANERLTRQNEELVERMREAEESRRLKNEFLANISHEFRTPLTSIMGYAYLLASGHTGELTDRQKELVQKIERAGTALLGLITDLLELSQLKLGRAEVLLGPEEAVALAKRSIQAVGPAPEGVELRLEHPDGEIPLTVDGEKVVKILENLLSNAYKFTSRGVVSVTVRRHADDAGVAPAVVDEERPYVPPGSPARVGPVARPEGWVEWRVSDTGIGIRPEDLHVIFDEFRQVDGSSTRLYGGTGLGLALSLRLARLLGGDILVDSEPGRGSTFTLRLPITTQGSWRYPATAATPCRE